MKKVKTILSFSRSDFLISTISAIIAIVLTAFIQWYYSIGLFLIFNAGVYYFKFKQEQKLELYNLKADLEGVFNDLYDLVKHPEGRIKNNFPKFVEILSKEKKDLAESITKEANSHKIIGHLLSQGIIKLRLEKPNSENLKWFLHMYYIILYYVQEEYIKKAHLIAEKEDISIIVENGFNDLLQDYNAILDKSDKIKNLLIKLTKEDCSAYYFAPEKIRKVTRMRLG